MLQIRSVHGKLARRHSKLDWTSNIIVFSRSVSGFTEDDRNLSGYDYNPTFGLVIAGGGKPELNTTEASHDGVTFEPLPDMPRPGRHFCLLSLDPTSLLVIGCSYSDSGHDHVYRYTAGDSDWESLDGPARPRCGSGCGVVTERTGRKYVVVAGGQEAPYSSEIFDLETLEWSIGSFIIDNLIKRTTSLSVI